jgi:hypothetical protein
LQIDALAGAAIEHRRAAVDHTQPRHQRAQDIDQLEAALGSPLCRLRNAVEGSSCRNFSVLETTAATVDGRSRTFV